MTDKIFFDTDCICAFLWVEQEIILERLYTGRIILPKQVYDEISKVNRLLTRTDTLKNKGVLSIESIDTDSEEFNDYMQMTSSPEPGMRIIGPGEAASIAMVKRRGGTLASNNMRDIVPYVSVYGISHITTGDIMIEALRAGMITEAQGNTIWSNMIRRRRLLPTDTFSDYLASKGI